MMQTRKTQTLAVLPVDLKSDVRTLDGLLAQNVDDVAVCDAGPMLLFSSGSVGINWKSTFVRKGVIMMHIIIDRLAINYH